ncbi:hypothetical protein DL769_000466 [Monosporascus sp. CRB-8-3]|nr:hypothetical protein DL769_000466 [Monosporascus sp. CRB-8-3]
MPRLGLALVLCTLSALLEFVAIVGAKYTYRRSSINQAYPFDADKYTKELILNANANPNGTRSVPFYPFEGNKNVPEMLQKEKWVWRVNVTDFAAPNAAGGFVDPHVVNTVYDFTWPSGGNFASAIGHPMGSFCTTTLLVYSMPVNVTNRYTEEDTGSADCSGLFGEECVARILNDATLTDPSQSCVNATVEWSDLPECADTLGYTIEQASISSLLTYEIADLDLRPGDGFMSFTTGAFHGADSTYYLNAAHLAQVMLIDTSLIGVEKGGKLSGGPQLLCMRVNATEMLSEGENGNGGGDADDSENGGNDDGGDAPEDRENEENSTTSEKFGAATTVTWAAMSVLGAVAFSM